MKLAVAHRTYTVRPQVPKDVPAGKSWSGFCEKGRGVIGIDPKDVPEEQADTLIHEVLHAIWYTQSLPPEAEEEDAVTRLAHGLLQVIRDNPQFLAAINSALGGAPVVTKP